MTEQFKAIVRRRDAGDDDGCMPDEVWPSELRWVADWDRFDGESGRFVSGCVLAFKTHAEALAEAVAEADAVRRRNAAESATREVGGHDGHRIQESPTLTGKDVPRFCHTCEVEIEPLVRHA